MPLLKAAAVFSDNMVLQRNKPVQVWGTGTENETVCLVWEDGKKRVERGGVVKNGAWRVTLPPLDVCAQGTLSINDAIRFDNVAVGDVWFAGGQSNMELELQNCRNGHDELASCANADIRTLMVVKRAFVDADYLREDKETRWHMCAPETAAALSAVAYFFARKLNADLNVPIGIINCSWGGTSISCWMSEGQLARSAAGQRYLADYAALAGNKTDAQYDAEMKDYFDQWNAWDARLRAWREKEPDAAWETLNKECGICPWPQPAGKKSPFRPTNLYNARVKRIAPYALAGFIYYQGEEDDPRAGDYDEMMYYLIDQWRSDWSDDTLPFLFVQLPMYASREEVEAGQPLNAWCVLRENQYRASVRIANTALAVIIDRGEYDNIHPLDKQTVGFRLALQALKKVYHKNIEADGPIFSWAEPEAGTGIPQDALRLHFDHAESGLELRKSPSIAGVETTFEVAGEDGVYYPAQAEINGSDIVVRSEKVAKAERVRYGWIKFGPTPLFAKNGLPAMPFRSHKD
jgi:sialate O-acetylesterase